MSNIKTLSEAVDFLRDEFVNEITNHTNYQNPEVAELAEIIVDTFSKLASEVNGYDD